MTNCVYMPKLAVIPFQTKSQQPKEDNVRFCCWTLAITHMRGYGAGNICIKLLKRVLVLSEEHDKKVLAPYTTAAKTKFVLKKKFFLYLNGKVLLYLKH